MSFNDENRKNEIEAEDSEMEAIEIKGNNDNETIYLIDSGGSIDADLLKNLISQETWKIDGLIETTNDEDIDDDQGGDDKDFWTSKETEALIKARGAKPFRVVNALNKTRIWSDISDSMRNSGFDRSPTACDAKWRRLKMAYYRAKSKGEKGTKPGYLWKYYNLLDEIFSMENHALKSNDDHVYHKEKDTERTRSIEEDKWNYNNTILLLKCREKYKNEFTNAKLGLKIKIWRRIASDMEREGVHVTGEICYEKWRNLINRYRKLKERQKDNPECNIQWVYFKPLEDSIGEECKLRVVNKRKRSNEPNVELRVGNFSAEMNDDSSLAEPLTSTAPSGLDFLTSTILSELLRQRKSVHESLKEATKSFDERLRRLEEAEERLARRQKALNERDKDLLQHLKKANDLEERKVNALEIYLEKMSNTK